MKPSGLLALRIGSLLLTAFAARGAVETWDSGGADANFSTSANWADDTAPVSSLTDTDLIFGLAPGSANVDAPFSARRIDFSNIPGALAGFTIGGEGLSVGTGGILNNDPKTSIFTNAVSFAGVANTTISASGGALEFNGTVTLPTSVLTVTGLQNTSFANITGTSTLTKTGAGTMAWKPSVPAAFDVTISAGTFTLGGTSLVDVFASGAAVAVNGSSVFNINGNLTLDGALLTRTAGATMNLASGKSLTVQNGGDAILTGAYTAPSGATFAVSGAGSTFSTTGNLTLGNDTSTTITDGGSLSSGAAGLQIGTFGGSGNVGVDGAGSSVAAGSLLVGQNGFGGSLTLSNGSAGNFGAISVQDSPTAGAGSALSIESGATVTGTALNLATMPAATTGSITITGAGSALTLSGPATATIGAASGSTATLTVQSGGVFTTGTGLTTVNTTGDLNINAGGTMIVRGHMIVRSSLDIAGTVILSESATSAAAEEPRDSEFHVSILESAGPDLRVVPEPAAAALFTGGLALVAALHRRRHRAETQP